MYNIQLKRLTKRIDYVLFLLAPNKTKSFYLAQMLLDRKNKYPFRIKVFQGYKYRL